MTTEVIQTGTYFDQRPICEGGSCDTYRILPNVFYKSNLDPGVGQTLKQAPPQPALFLSEFAFSTNVTNNTRLGIYAWCHFIPLPHILSPGDGWQILRDGYRALL